MKQLFSIGILCCIFSPFSFAFEAGQLSLDTPNVLKKHEGSFGIRHRFYGKLDDFEKFLGTDDGGNMHFSVKYSLIDNFLIGIEHARSENAYGVGFEYSHDFDWIKAGLRVNGFRINQPSFEETQKSYMVNSSLQTPNYFEHLRLTTNLGYDYFYKHLIFGLGADININNILSFLTFTEEVSFLGEYYPQVDKVEGISTKYDAYAFGIKFQTFGHHFEILATNSSNMDIRTMSLGTDSNDLHFGFNINRKF